TSKRGRYGSQGSSSPAHTGAAQEKRRGSKRRAADKRRWRLFIPPSPLSPRARADASDRFYTFHSGTLWRGSLPPARDKDAEASPGKARALQSFLLPGQRRRSGNNPYHPG